MLIHHYDTESLKILYMNKRRPNIEQKTILLLHSKREDNLKFWLEVQHN